MTTGTIGLVAPPPVETPPSHASSQPFDAINADDAVAACFGMNDADGGGTDP